MSGHTLLARGSFRGSDKMMIRLGSRASNEAEKGRTCDEDGLELKGC